MPLAPLAADRAETGAACVTMPVCCCQPCSVHDTGVDLAVRCNKCSQRMHRLCSMPSGPAPGRLCTQCAQATAGRRSRRHRTMTDKGAAAWAAATPDPHPLMVLDDGDGDGAIDVPASCSAGGSDAPTGPSNAHDADDHRSGSSAQPRATPVEQCAEPSKRRKSRKRSRKRGGAQSAEAAALDAEDAARDAEEAANEAVSQVHAAKAAAHSQLVVEARIMMKKAQTKKNADLRARGKKVSSNCKLDYVVDSHAPPDLHEVDIPTPVLEPKPKRARVQQLSAVGKVRWRSRVQQCCTGCTTVAVCGERGVAPNLG